MIERLAGIRLSLTHFSYYKIFMLQKVDDMIIGVLEGPPSSPTQYTSVMRKVQNIIRQCMVSISGIRPQEPVPECGARRVKRGAHRLPGGRAREERERERGRGYGRQRYGDPGSYVPLDPFDNPDLDASTFSLGLMPIAPSHPSGADTSYVPLDPFDSLDADYVQPPPSAGGTSYAPLPPSTLGLSFDAPPPPGTVGSSVPYMPHNNLTLDIVLGVRLLDLLYLIIVRVLSLDYYL
ncbi:hypothetical protein M9H77_09094 [Catharanthus roseus]|uniref:Uncharacterized protein n=1 Tax=Catharanthus roseus TaxID=4058 RepID=A0ACC0BZU3_CATRO|nr:hypothetical protein M9H77_09094 [Catharanthus roseus]